jgi:hypothetical protein
MLGQTVERLGAYAPLWSLGSDMGIYFPFACIKKLQKRNKNFKMSNKKVILPYMFIIA